MIKITLCGSTRFMKQYHTWNKMLTLQGYVVYSVATGVHDAEEWVPTKEEKERLDLIHLVKIMESDAIFVINCSRTPDEDKLPPSAETYIGDSTRREIEWARLLGKRVTFSSKEGPALW